MLQLPSEKLALVWVSSVKETTAFSFRKCHSTGLVRIYSWNHLVIYIYIYISLFTTKAVYYMQVMLPR